MDVFLQVFSVSLLSVILTKTAPLLLASLGGAFTQQGNILNIGLEGMMLIGAFTSVSVGAATGSALVGVAAAIVAGLLLALLFAIATLWLNADAIVVGIGINLLATGLSVFLLQVLYGNPGTTPPGTNVKLPRINLGVIGDIPVIGPLFNNQTPVVWFALLAVPLASVVLYRTRFGVHLRAVGEDEQAAKAAGIRVRTVKFQSVLLSGILCGLAGAQLAMATLGSFTAGMTAGRGFIAVAAITFGLARPVRTMVAAAIFGIAEGIADQLSIAGINSNLALMTPYVVTIVALVFVGVRYGHAIKSRRAEAIAKADKEKQMAHEEVMNHAS